MPHSEEKKQNGIKKYRKILRKSEENNYLCKNFRGQNEN